MEHPGGASLEVVSWDTGISLGFLDSACLSQPAILPKGFLDLEPEAGKGVDEAIVLGSKLTP